MQPPDFASLGLSSATLTALTRAGYEKPTPIQAQTIPHALAGKDVIGCAATGTGKTASFVLPIVERLKGKKGTRALVLAPTRELALQIHEHAVRFGAPHGVKAVAVIGGVGMGGQKDGLSYSQLVIATPGRLIDHLNEGNVTLANIEVLVLDEADRMLDMGFKPQLTRIVAKLPRTRQTLLFSATMAGEVATFAKQNSRDPVRVEVARSGTTAERATQCVFEVSQGEKNALLLTLLSKGDETTLVFTRTKRRADKLTKVLGRDGHAVERIHADRSQAQRKHALDGFKSGKYRVLVATDIAARGIDVADIGHVVNYDLPHVPEDYVHRVGRTARAAASGHASAFCASEEVPLLRDIEKLLRVKIPREPLPKTDPVFIKAMEDERSRQSNPGPRRQDHGVSQRPAGQAPGRHARSHQRNARVSSSGGGGGGGRQQQGGGGQHAGGGEKKPSTVFSGSPRRR
ncbi:MAG: ATP-dependent helicase [Archangium gephyra]|uniref:ATP-dependent helicase n=1 Tax=Archangium gephyra TaxID=48 RepID=A0A2W5TPC4_9BACT|nr:MAG: ATP-dependent helicase [Archangium gephyra]